MSKEIFHLARHGRTAGNEKDIYRGWSNKEFAQLDDAGKNDAREAGIFLKGLGLEFPLIITDDLERTCESAHIIADILGIQDVISDKRMRPLNVGDFTGKSKDKYPLEEYLKNKSKKIPGGESVAEFDRRQAKVFDDILQTIIETKQPVLVVGHGSNVSYLHNAVQKDKKVGYEGLVNPGGIVSFAKDAVTPIFKKRDGEKKTENKSAKQKLIKIDQAVVLYMNAAEIGKSKGAHCDDCRMFIGKAHEMGKCGAVAGEIDGEKGVCGLYVFGEPNQFTESGILSKETVGYVEIGPTHCHTCEYFGGVGQCEKVEESPKTIEDGGCCNAYEPEKESEKETEKK